MSSAPQESAWRFYRIGLIVTGEGEQEFLPDLLRPLAASGRCAFKVIRKIGQRKPQTSPRRVLRMAGSGQTIPDKDVDEIGLPARRFLEDTGEDALVLLVDDREQSRVDIERDVFRRYRDALDKILLAQKHRAAVHFLVNMIEAYYFADAAAINAVLGTSLLDHAGDVETIPHPKGELKKLKPGFDEKAHGKAIVAALNIPYVLSNPVTCASLRTLFAWCCKAIGEPLGSQYQLDSGNYSVVTGPQIGEV